MNSNDQRSVVQPCGRGTQLRSLEGRRKGHVEGADGHRRLDFLERFRDGPGDIVRTAVGRLPHAVLSVERVGLPRGRANASRVGLRAFQRDRVSVSERGRGGVGGLSAARTHGGLSFFAALRCGLDGAPERFTGSVSG